MKTFFFREILLASFKEKKARRFAFDPNVTVIRGENETGKSSLLKSLFRSFGAEPAKVHSNWRNADVRSLVRFDVDGRSFAMLRHGEQFAAFDAEGKLVERFQRVTSELAPFIAKLVGFGLRLPNRQGEFVVLPPAYYFLPFYMDQDGSWQNQWSGFARLEQFANWKRGVIEYHAGIRGNDYYESQAAKFNAEAERKKVERRREGLQEVYGALGKRFEAAQFDVDFTAYRSEIDELLRQCGSLRRKEEKFKHAITDLRNQRQTLQTQLDITTHARQEASKDYSFAGDHTEEIQCPTCGATYENSFTERFAIAMDEDRCAGLIVRLTEELGVVDARIEAELDAAKKVTEEIVAIERLLARREGEIALGDLIRQEGRRELRDVMQHDFSALEEQEGELRMKAATATKRMRQLEGKERRQEVNGAFYETMKSFLRHLDVMSIAESAIQHVDASLHDTGSELPRALLAYKLAFVEVARRFGTAAIAPLVIDSPNQQDQDDTHLEKILHFIRDHRPEGTQLILGLVDAARVEFGGTEIVLDRKYNLLSEDQFGRVGEEMQHYINLALG